MVWGCILWEGVGYACKIEGIMDKEVFVEILENHLQDSLEYYGKNSADIIFQQDNDSKHNANMAKAWFKEHKMEVLSWPAQSPDLNSIEHLWTHLKLKLGEYQEPPKGVLELWKRMDKEWNKIDSGVCQNLIESMLRRIAAVIKAKGGYIKY